MESSGSILWVMFARGERSKKLYMYNFETYTPKVHQHVRSVLEKRQSQTPGEVSLSIFSCGVAQTCCQIIVFSIPFFICLTPPHTPHATLRHLISPHVTSCHLTPPHVTSCRLWLTSCHLTLTPVFYALLDLVVCPCHPVIAGECATCQHTCLLHVGVCRQLKHDVLTRYCTVILIPGK